MASGGRCFVARHEGRIVHAGWVTGADAWIDYLGCAMPLATGDAYQFGSFTDPAFRGRGIAAARVAAMARALRAEGYRRLVACVLPENADAWRPLERVRYRVAGRISVVRLGPWRRVRVRLAGGARPAPCGYWDDVLADMRAAPPIEAWRAYMRRVYADLVGRWFPAPVAGPRAEDRSLRGGHLRPRRALRARPGQRGRGRVAGHRGRGAPAARRRPEPAPLRRGRSAGDPAPVRLDGARPRRLVARSLRRQGGHRQEPRRVGAAARARRRLDPHARQPAQPRRVAPQPSAVRSAEAAGSRSVLRRRDLWARGGPRPARGGGLRRHRRHRGGPRSARASHLAGRPRRPPARRRASRGGSSGSCGDSSGSAAGRRGTGRDTTWPCGRGSAARRRPSADMQCGECQADIRPGQAFCGSCGAPLPRSCPSCSAPSEPGANFCGRCGASLRGASAAGGPAAAPRGHTPPHLAERILSGRRALEGERKLVTVLFADLKGSMEILANRDPEEARRVLDPVLERMMDAVHQYEGTVNQVMGDGIMALFGAPVAREDHAVRAGYAALTMQKSIAEFARQHGPVDGVEVRIRVGLNSGEVVVRGIGNDLTMDYSAIGQTTHLASRMEQLAAPGSDPRHRGLRSPHRGAAAPEADGARADQGPERAARGARAGGRRADARALPGRGRPRVHPVRRPRRRAGGDPPRRGAGARGPRAGRRRHRRAGGGQVAPLLRARRLAGRARVADARDGLRLARQGQRALADPRPRR